jgi:transcriptional regulator with XRE-family HTH domain
MTQATGETPITDRLRRTISDSGLPLLRLSKETGVARASLIRFVRGDSSLRLDVADKLAEYFGLELSKKRVR